MEISAQERAAVNEDHCLGYRLVVRHKRERKRLRRVWTKQVRIEPLRPSPMRGSFV